MDIALLVLRLVIGLILVGHGSQKLFGWFGGGGVAGTATVMEKMGFAPGKPMAVLAGLGEAAGGILLALGFLNPLAAFALIAVMINAVAPHWGNGPFVTSGGWELPVTYATVAGALAFIGPGAISLDNALGWTLYSTGWGITAVVAGLVAGGMNLGLRSIRRTTSEQPA